MAFLAVDGFWPVNLWATFLQYVLKTVLSAVMFGSCLPRSRMSSATPSRYAFSAATRDSFWLVHVLPASGQASILVMMSRTIARPFGTIPNFSMSSRAVVMAELSAVRFGTPSWTQISEARMIDL